MREIKFRAWDQYKKVMTFNMEDIYFSYIDNESFGPWMQFIGFKDKNGKEIYEGDLLQHMDDEGVYYEVFFHEHTAKFCINITHYQGNRCGGYIPDIAGPFLKVVGNIYENPELCDVNVALDDGDGK